MPSAILTTDNMLYDVRMQSLISIVPGIVKDKFNTISINLTIRDNWNKMFSNELLKLMSFEKAMFSMVGNTQVLNVVIGVLSSAVIFVKAKINSIKKSIQLLTGISKIRIILHQTSGLNISTTKVIQCP